MHTCKVSVRDLVEFILRSGDIVSSSTGIRDTDAMQEGTRIHKKLQKQMGSQSCRSPIKIHILCVL